MNPCTRVGVDVTWKCNWKCAHCFYRRNTERHATDEELLPGVYAKIDQAKAGGLDHVVLVGYGEPSLASTAGDILTYAHEREMVTSMITNGATGLDRFRRLFDHGLDHLHISSHGLDGTLDEIAGIPGAFAKQTELKKWLAAEGLPYRTNTTLQQANYRELPGLADYEISHGVYHFVFLGFIPHYEWKDHLLDVAVHPAILRPHIEEAARRLRKSGTLFTIRYHPLCHLDYLLWPYVVNARYVFADPWEWNYELQVTDPDALWKASKAMGNSLANKGKPCSQCSAYRHCGGWNGIYAKAFDGAGLRAIKNPPDIYREVWNTDGGLHDLNPANRQSGTIQREASMV